MSDAFIEVYTGRRIYPLDLRVNEVDIRDIAHSLSQQCRFLGHTRRFYSVAEHSVRVALLLADWGEDVETQRWGLLHDASEAYLVDVPTPLKAHPVFEMYRAAETAVQAAICERFGLPLREPDAVRRADRVLLSTEARDLMHFTRSNWLQLEMPPLEDRISPRLSEAAEAQFFLCARRLEL